MWHSVPQKLNLCMIYRVIRGTSRHPKYLAMSKRKAQDESAAPAKKKSLGPAWQVGLLKALDDKSTQLFADDRVVVINDAYKKALSLRIARVF